MIDELTILKDILGDLTNAGIWGVAIYVGYKLAVFGGTAGTIIYLVRFIGTKIFEYVKSDITRSEADKIKRCADEQVKQAVSQEQKWRDEAAEARRTANEVKSMYKILKQKYGCSDE